MIIKIISGGQTGADQGALIAAARAGIATGGWAPRDFRTETGPQPMLGTLYGLKEHRSADYPARTAANVKDSDGTIWFGTTTSRGYSCTRNAAHRARKPFTLATTPQAFAEWVNLNNIRTLNVAGNRESVQFGIRNAVQMFLTTVLR